MKRNYIFSVLTITFICLVVPAIGFAQVDPGCDPFDPGCPIDGGVSLLIAAGIGIAAKKAHMERNKKKGLMEANNK